jgi:hypothetical protein
MAIKETFKLSAKDLLNKIEALIKEGNVTKITIADKQGNELMNFPVNIGLLGIVFAPILAAVGALAAYMTECTLTIERKGEPQNKKEEDRNFEEAD